MWSLSSPGPLPGALQEELERRPERGGVRQARLGNPLRGTGKRGGYRYLYLYLEKRQHIHLLILLDKNEQEEASKGQRRQIRDWVAPVKKDSGE